MPKSNTPKLNDTQLIIPSSASQRRDGLAVLPEKLKGGAATKVVSKLLDQGFLKEVRAKRNEPHWRVDENEHPIWRNEKHRAQWKMTLSAYCGAIRSIPVGDISTEDVLRVLRPIWLTKSETASRLRGRIERVLDFAKARGMRTGENPARWRGHLDAVLPRRQKLQRGHHKALPFHEVPAFVSRLRGLDGVAPRALEFLILTAGRTGEVLGATWDEIDFESGIWVVPAKRMKAGREHRVPLSDRALAILAELGAVRTGEYVFPGLRRDKPLSNMAMEAVLRRMAVDATVHGFRSAFRDWAGERTHFAREIAEAALAHLVGDAVERAYRRGDALQKRRDLMGEWMHFCSCGSKILVLTHA